MARQSFRWEHFQFRLATRPGAVFQSALLSNPVKSCALPADRQLRGQWVAALENVKISRLRDVASVLFARGAFLLRLRHRSLKKLWTPPQPLRCQVGEICGVSSESSTQSPNSNLQYKHGVDRIFSRQGGQALSTGPSQRSWSFRTLPKRR